MSELSNIDQQNIWHPYTQEKIAGENIVIVKGEGAYLYDELGNQYIDGISSWWTNLHGHAHPHIAKAIADQAHTLEQVIFAGFTHPLAITLSQQLLAKLPNDFSKVFYSDNGSTAVEAAIKMTLQYWSNQGQDRKKIICFKDAYHGDTFGAMSVSARGVFTAPYARHLFEVVFIDTPTDDNEELVAEQLSLLIENHKQDIAAFIFEPLVLGSAGMLMYAPSVLNRLLTICKEHQVLTIADEVFTGFGRTGKLFAIEYVATVPDIICLSKGITGGFLPFATTICQQHIYDAFYDTDKAKMLFHGHSYTGNPLGCAAAIASLELFEQENTLEKINQISASHTLFAMELRRSKNIKEVRQTGTILAIEYEVSDASGYLSSLKDKLYQHFISRHIILRPLGNVLYVLPPYCISMQDLQIIYQAIRDFH